MYPEAIQKLIDTFSKFPTVGPRTATRFVFYLIEKPKHEVQDLVSRILKLKDSIKICNFCFNPFEAEIELCEICENKTRDKTTLCVVEKETDLISIENTKKYKGLYFILGGTLSSLKKLDVEKIRTKELLERIQNPSNFGIEGAGFKEIIIATNPTADGEATGLYVERLLKNFGFKITKLGRGLPVGGELEYADENTLSSALDNRR